MGIEMEIAVWCTVLGAKPVAVFGTPCSALAVVAREAERKTCMEAVAFFVARLLYSYVYICTLFNNSVKMQRSWDRASEPRAEFRAAGAGDGQQDWQWLNNNVLVDG